MSTLSTKVALPEGVMFRELDGEAVVLELGSGRYFGLNETGTRMWTVLLEHGKVEPALRMLLKEYDVAEDQLLGELLRFVDDLASQRLLLTDES